MIREGQLGFDDNAIGDSSTSKHGFLKKLSNVATEFMNGEGNWATPEGGGGGGRTQNIVTSGTQALAADNDYLIDNATLCTATLPTTCAKGKKIEVSNCGAGGFRIGQNADQSIIDGLTSETTSVGTGGYLTADQRYSAVTLQCIVADTTFIVVSQKGGFTVS